MKSFKQIISIIFLSILICSSVEAKQYEVNTQHSFVNFELPYMKVSKVKGAFEEFKGSFKLDEDTNEVSELFFVIKAGSISTRDLKRDNHLRGNNFFNVKKYPLISFSGNSYKYEKGLLAKVTGILQLSGIEKTVTFDIDWKGLQDDPISKGKKSLFLVAEVTIDRKEFGISWNRMFDDGGWIVGNEVKVEAVIEANPTDARLAFSRFFMPSKDRNVDIQNVAKKKEVKPSVDKVSNKQEAEVSKDAVEVKEDSNSSATTKSTHAITALNNNETKKHSKSSLNLLVSIICLSILVLVSIFFKKHMLSLFEKFMSERAAELLSDTILYSLLLIAAVVSAPYMGYGNF